MEEKSNIIIPKNSKIEKQFKKQKIKPQEKKHNKNVQTEKPPFISRLFTFVLGFMLTFSVCLSLIKSFNEKASTVTIIIYTFAAFLLFFLLTYNKYTIIGLTALFVVGVPTFFYVLSKSEALYDKIYEYIQWLINYSSGFMVLLENYYNITLIIICMSFAFLFCIFTVRLSSIPMVFITGMAVFCAQWALEMFVSYTAFYIFLFSLLLFYINYVYNKRMLAAAQNESDGKANKSDYSPLWKIILLLLPFCIALFFLVVRAPYSEKPITITWLDKKVSDAVDYFNFISRRYTNYEFFSLSETGFGQTGWLGGNVNVDRTKVLTVRSSSPGIYLRGSVMATYTGNRWISPSSVKTYTVSDTDPREEYVVAEGSLSNIYTNKNVIENGEDYSDKGIAELETGFANISGRSEIFYRYFTRNDITVTYERLRTRSVFTPLKGYKYTFPDAIRYLNMDQHNVFTAPSPVQDGFSYQSTAYELTTLDENMQAILRKAGQGFYERLDDLKIGKLRLEFEVSDGAPYSFTVKKAFFDDKEIAFSHINRNILIDTGPVVNSFSNSGLNMENIVDSSDKYLTLSLSQKGNSSSFGGTLFVVSETEQGIKINENTSLGQIFQELDTQTLSVNSFLDNNGYGIEIVSQGNIIKGVNVAFDFSPKTGLQNYRQLKDYSTSVKKDYLSLPQSLPQRVIDLAAEITQGFDNDYDKAKAIEEYLSKNYRYTLRPGRVPPGVDFVDYFLFENKKGYCSYYASAMVIMLRSQGIPARYAEGFVLSQERDQNNTYSVTNQSAHAWPEVYLEGLGWFTFEPTSAYTDLVYERIVPAPTTDETQNSEPLMPVMTPPSDAGTSSDLPITPDVAEEKTMLEKITFWTIVALLSLLALIILIIIINVVRINYFLKHLRTQSKDVSVKKLYTYFLKLNKLIGEPIYDHETPLEYCNRLYSGEKSLILQHSGVVNFYTVTNIFMSVEYGNKIPENESFEKVMAFYDKAIEKARYSLGFFTYIKYRFFTGKL